MKKIINGKKYDTETAKAMGYWCNMTYGLNFVEETLYKKKTGEYFLHGEGGPATKYAEIYENNSSSGEKIIPMTEDEAKDWAEKKLTGDKYEEIFGEVEE